MLLLAVKDRPRERRCAYDSMLETAGWDLAQFSPLKKIRSALERFSLDKIGQNCRDWNRATIGRKSEGAWKKGKNYSSCTPPQPRDQREAAVSYTYAGAENRALRSWRPHWRKRSAGERSAARRSWAVGTATYRACRSTVIFAPSLRVRYPSRSSNDDIGAGGAEHLPSRKTSRPFSLSQRLAAERPQEFSITVGVVAGGNLQRQLGETAGAMARGRHHSAARERKFGLDTLRDSRLRASVRARFGRADRAVRRRLRQCIGIRAVAAPSLVCGRDDRRGHLCIDADSAATQVWELSRSGQSLRLGTASVATGAWSDLGRRAGFVPATAAWWLACTAEAAQPPGHVRLSYSGRSNPRQ